MLSDRASKRFEYSTVVLMVSILVHKAGMDFLNVVLSGMIGGRLCEDVDDLLLFIPSRLLSGSDFESDVRARSVQF